MKDLIASSLVAITFAFSQAAIAQMNHNMPMGHSMPSAQAAKTTVAAADAAALGDGVVKSVNKAKGTALIAHGALPNGMPPMTMAYKLKNPAWLDQLKSGQAIRFATDAQGTTVLRIEGLK